MFCLCGVEIYQTLADQFTGERPVYGVFAQDEIAFIEAQQQKGQLEYSFDKLVDSYVEAIKRQGELSRMTLVGLSFGGLVALEAAKRFRKEVWISQAWYCWIPMYPPAFTARFPN